MLPISRTQRVEMCLCFCHQEILLSRHHPVPGDEAILFCCTLYLFHLLWHRFLSTPYSLSLNSTFILVSFSLTYNMLLPFSDVCINQVCGHLVLVCSTPFCSASLTDAHICWPISTWTACVCSPFPWHTRNCAGVSAVCSGFGVSWWSTQLPA